MNYGKIVEYDGNTGNITDINGENHLLLQHELKDKSLKENDYVMFKSEKFETPEIKENVARFVKKLNKENYSK